MLLYGPPKVGKTTMLSKLDNCLIIDTESGSSMIEGYIHRVKNRAELIEIKPSNQTGFSKEGKSIHTQKASAINQAKWEAAYKWSKGKGIKFRVVTEHEIFSNTVKRK